MEDQCFFARFCGDIPKLLCFAQTGIQIVIHFIQIAALTVEAGDPMGTGIGACRQSRPHRRCHCRMSPQQYQIMPLRASCQKCLCVGHFAFVHIFARQPWVHAINT